MKKIIEKIFYSTIILGLFFIISINQIDNSKEIRKKELITNNENELFEIQFIDVGEAESILINNNNKYVLIDAGNNKDGKKLVNYLKEEGVDSFEYVITTHAHEDHIGGMDYIIKNFKINNFYIPNIDINNITYQEVIEALDKKNIKKETPLIDSEFKMENTLFKILSINDNEEDLNYSCIIIKVIYYNNSFLLMSDATGDLERTLISKDIKSDVLKVSHHGSKYSTISSFLNKVKPKYAVIQVGKNNDYDLPKQIVLDKLEKVGAITYRTDINGTIIMNSDGNNIIVKTINTDTNQE